MSFEKMYGQNLSLSIAKGPVHDDDGYFQEAEIIVHPVSDKVTGQDLVKIIKPVLRDLPSSNIHVNEHDVCRVTLEGSGGFETARKDLDGQCAAFFQRADMALGQHLEIKPKLNGIDNSSAPDFNSAGLRSGGHDINMGNL